VRGADGGGGVDSGDDERRSLGTPAGLVSRLAPTVCRAFRRQKRMASVGVRQNSTALKAGDLRNTLPFVFIAA